MDPLTTENARRADVLSRLAELVKISVDGEVERKKSRIDSIAATMTAKSPTRSIDYKRAELLHFQSVAFKDTVAMLETYETETLEHVWAAFAEQDKGKRRLHLWTSYNGAEWNRVTHGYRDAIFLDILALRGYTSAKSEHRVHALLDTYRALGLKPGDIHAMDRDERHLAVSPVFLIACGSRGVVWLRRGNEMKRTDDQGNFIPPVEPEVHEDYKGDHLFPEAVEYVSGYPKRGSAMWDYMAKNRQTLKEMDFSLFLLQQETHSSLKDGVL